MSKGSRRRPTDTAKYGESHDRIFGKKKVNIHSSGKREVFGNNGPSLLHSYDPYSYGKRPVFVSPEVEKANYERVFGKGESDVNANDKG